MICEKRLSYVSAVPAKWALDKLTAVSQSYDEIIYRTFVSNNVVFVFGRNRQSVRIWSIALSIASILVSNSRDTFRGDTDEIFLEFIFKS